MQVLTVASSPGDEHQAAISFSDSNFKQPRSSVTFAQSRLLIRDKRGVAAIFFYPSHSWGGIRKSVACIHDLPQQNTPPHSRDANPPE
jgi:hypothetical protein